MKLSSTELNSTLEQAFATASPRITPRKPSNLSNLIHWFILAFTLIIFSRYFISNGIYAWSTGLAYVFYDTALLIFVTWQTLPLLKKQLPHNNLQPLPQATKPSSNNVGVIIAAYNEVDVLGITIKALMQQHYVPDQIIIADDGSDDGTTELLMQEYGFDTPTVGKISTPSQVHPKLYWLRVPHKGKATALNAAIKQVYTDIVITVDADTLLDINAIAAMRDAFEQEPQLVAATGVLTPICNNTVTGRFFQWFQTYEYIRNFISRFAWMRVNGLLLISGAFAGFKREALLEVGGFDTACLVEDYELIHRLRRYAVEHQRDWAVRVLGNALAITSAPSTLTGFLLQRRRWFAGFLQTQYWNRDMTGSPRFGNLGTMMLPVKAIDTMQPFYGVIAFLLLISFIGSYFVTGKTSILLAVLLVIVTKIVIDLVFHLWSIYLYQRWTGQHSKSLFFYAIVAAILEPFSFQLLRHTGALMGWFYFLSGKQKWGKQSRQGFN